jgi:hypothetical protein
MAERVRNQYRRQLRIGGRPLAFLVSADGTIQPG